MKDFVDGTAFNNEQGNRVEMEFMRPESED